MFGSLNLTTVKLSGVGSSFQKHLDAESKGIKAHFNMDESGVLLLDRVSILTSIQTIKPVCQTFRQNKHEQQENSGRG